MSNLYRNLRLHLFHLSDIGRKITRELEMEIRSRSFRPESFSVLKWKDNSYRRQQIFVANRVPVILDENCVEENKTTKVVIFNQL